MKSIWFIAAGMFAALVLMWVSVSCKTSRPSLPREGRIIAASHHGELETALQHAERMTGMRLIGTATVYLDEGDTKTHHGWKGKQVNDYKGQGAGIIGGVQQFKGRAVIYLTDGRVWLNNAKTSNAVHELAHLIYSSHGIKGEDAHHERMKKAGFVW